MILHVPTRTAEGEPRHIIRHRDGPTWCGAEVTGGEQHAPADIRAERLCPRCRQKYLRWLAEPGQKEATDATDLPA